MQLRAPGSDTGYERNAGRDATIIIPCDFGDFSGSELPLLHYSASVSQTRGNGIKVNFSAAPAAACKKKPRSVFLLHVHQLQSVCSRLSTGLNPARRRPERSALMFDRPRSASTSMRGCCRPVQLWPPEILTNGRHQTHTQTNGGGV